ncbi:circadian clock KaiB family protein [Thalassoroseus pseudoceratinae]|uniref:circadian clock KaiB family protein n=1 Tax=Thalassoroseus pseudoceratinae TaxID=2713176 RepID=UPI001421864F|nr:circadian clock KaiB family protein [Thalassoroseus pseudoceratinae]
MNVRRHRAVELALTLYVSRLDSDHECMVRSLREAIENRLNTDQTYALEVIDVSTKPESAREHIVYATPTLVKISPAPERRIVGDLNNCREILEEWMLVEEQ